MKHSLELSTHITASPAEVWSWMTSIDGIAREMAPSVQMSAPKGVKRLAAVKPMPGQRLFRSWITLFGIVPCDYCDLTWLSPEKALWRSRPWATCVCGAPSDVLLH